MDKNFSMDPRSVRARHALHEALKKLLKERPFNKITVTDISNEAGLSRHTFYNHYETKLDLLNSIVDSILNQFFSNIEDADAISIDPDADQRIGERFFQIWLDNADVVKLLNSVDIDDLLVDRLQTHFSHYLHRYIDGEQINVSPRLSPYLTYHNAYAFAGILRQWLKDDMKYSPKIMGEFLNHFSSHEKNMDAIAKFNDVIR